MNAILAIGIPTTSDDRGYLLWLAENWPALVVMATALGALLVAWLVQKARSWTAGPPPSLPAPDFPETKNSEPAEPISTEDFQLRPLFT